jgi:hypothetical protein
MNAELRILDRAEWPPKIAVGLLGDHHDPSVSTIYLVGGGEINGEAVFIPVIGPADPAEALAPAVILGRAASVFDTLAQNQKATPKQEKNK